MSELESLSLSFNRAQASLVTQTADLPLSTLAAMVDEGSIDLAPSFQRRERWKPEDQSALIESFLLNVPVPPIYLSEEDDGRYSAIDGKQRLRAIADFMGDRLILRGLERMPEGEGRRFSEMPNDIRNALKLRPYLRVVTLLKQTDEQLKYEVFLRLNRGGESLNAQEIRNVAFRSPMNIEIYKQAEHPFLKRQLKITSDRSEAYRQMQDAEFVLRFLSLHNHVDDFKGNLVRHMDNFMLSHERTPEEAAASIAQEFTKAIDASEQIWGENAFQRPDGPGWRDQLLAGMFDAQMLSIANLTEEQLNAAVERKEEIIDSTRDLFLDDLFDKSVRTGTNTPARIRYRVQKMTSILVGDPANEE